MLRIRDSSGKVQELTSTSKAVEFLAPDGKIAVVVYLDSVGNMQYFTAGSDAAKRYAAHYPDAVFTKPG